MVPDLPRSCADLNRIGTIEGARQGRFWDDHSSEPFNERQLNILLDDFEGKLTSSKWAKITRCSQDTALRDIQDLLERKILEKENAGGSC